jgi:single-strand DNA-binding protein
MARGVNKVVLIGTLGRDPDCRTLPGSNTSVATFSIATNENYKDQTGAVQTRTEWHRLVLWNGLANIARQYLRKGSLIYVEGKLRTRSYDDNNGVKRYVTEIYVSELEMLGGNPNGSSPNNAYNNASQPNNGYANNGAPQYNNSNRMYNNSNAHSAQAQYPNQSYTQNKAVPEFNDSALLSNNSFGAPVESQSMNVPPVPQADNSFDNSDDEVPF